MTNRLKEYLYYQDNWATIYCGNCRDILPMLELVDLIITSPPYNLGGDFHSMSGGKRLTFSRNGYGTYNDNMDEQKYQSEQLSFLEMLNYLGMSTVFYIHKNRIKNGFLISPYSWIFKSSFKIIQEIVLDYDSSAATDKCRFWPVSERIYWLSNMKHDRDLPLDIAKLKDIWRIRKNMARIDHPAIFSIEIPTNIIRGFDGLICDPFMGSGTTLLAAKNLNRKSIGIEIEERYCKIAVERLRQSIFDFRKDKK